MFKTKMLVGLVLALLVGGLLFFDLDQGVQRRLDLSKSANVVPSNNVVRQVPLKNVQPPTKSEADLLSDLRNLVSNYQSTYLNHFLGKSWVVTENVCLSGVERRRFADFLETMRISTERMFDIAVSADRADSIDAESLGDFSEAVFAQIMIADEMKEITSLLSENCLPGHLKELAFPGFQDSVPAHSGFLDLRVIPVVDQINQLP